MSDKKIRYAVLGTGSAGHALAALISAKGYEVNCYDTDAEKMRRLGERGSILSENKLEGDFPIRLATADPGNAIEGCDILMVSACTCDHADIAAKIAPFIRADQLVVLNPGATCGALEFINALRANGAGDIPVVAETQDLMCTCRSNAPGTVNITGIKSLIALATIPSSAAGEVCKKLEGFFPNYYPQPNTLYTSLGNMAVGSHPANVVLNATRIEAEGDYYFFREGYTASCGRVEEAVDAERRAIAKAFGIDLISTKQWLLDTYGSDGADLCEAKKNTAAYWNVKGPAVIESRYVFEDLPTGILPMTQLARVAGVPTPMMDAVLQFLSVMTGKDYFHRGRTLKALGLEGKSVEDILAMLS